MKKTRAQEELFDRLEKARTHKTSVEATLLDLLEEALPHTYIQLKARVKSRRSLTKKIEKKLKDKPAYSVSDVTDIIGFRFVCHFQSDVEQIIDFILGLIREGKVFAPLHEPPRLYTTRSHNQLALYSAIERVFKKDGKELQREEKESRYTSIHLVCPLKEFPDFKTEIQIRNVFEEAWSQIEHALRYKGDGSLPSAAERHLRVLNSYVQTCCEYSEAIVSDIRIEPVEKSGIFQVFSDEANLDIAPAWMRSFLIELVKLQTKGRHKEAIERIDRFKEEQKERLLSDHEAQYVIQMEKALCYLMLGEPSEAINIYNPISEKMPDRALVYFRIADAYRLLGEYTKASEYLDLAIEKEKSTTKSTLEIEWLRRKLPLKKAYILWKLGNTENALHEVKGAYPTIKEKNDPELTKLYLNSMSYYEIELASSGEKKPSAKRLRELKKELEDYGFSSITNSEPELVDTYAWICHLAGDHETAYKAISGVEKCIQYPEGPETPFLSFKERSWAISQSDFNLIHYHIVTIKTAYNSSI